MRNAIRLMGTDEIYASIKIICGKATHVYDVWVIGWNFLDVIARID